MVEISMCHKLPKTIYEYKIIARNRLNRRKPDILAKYVFTPIIFDLLYKV